MAVKGKEEVYLVRPGELDHNGDPVDGGGATTLGIFKQCIVWARVSTEVQDVGTVISAGHNVFIPSTRENDATLDEVLEVRPTDIVVVRGGEENVVGVPADQRTMKGKRLGIQIVTSDVQ